MQIQRLVDLEDYEFDTLLVTNNHKNRLSIELGKVSEIFESLQADGLVGGSKVYGLRGKDFSNQGQPYYNLIFIGIPEKATPRRFQLQFGQAMKEAKRFHGKNLLMTAIGEDVSYWLSSAMKGLLLADFLCLSCESCRSHHVRWFIYQVTGCCNGFCHHSCVLLFLFKGCRINSCQNSKMQLWRFWLIRNVFVKRVICEEKSLNSRT